MKQQTEFSHCVYKLRKKWTMDIRGELKEKPLKIIALT